MTKKNDQQHLLDDVLAGEADAGFHAALLAETLRRVRNRRRSRHAQRVAALVVVVSMFTAVTVWRNPRSRVSLQPPQALNYELTLSQPFPATSIVSTRPQVADQLLAASAVASVLHTTAMRGSYREVGDDELLALAAPEVAALVRRGPQEVELVFIQAPVEATPGQY